VPREEVLRLHASSGTTGKPIVVGYTKGDLDLWSDLMARTLACTGARPGDIVHNAYGYGLFTGGLGFHYGAERLGCTVVPVSGGGTERQVTLIQDFGATILCATPSYALNIVEVAERMGVDIGKLPLRRGGFGAEPWSEPMRRDLEARLGIKAVDIYGLSEIIGPGVASECDVAQNGLHGWEDHFLFEIIDPHTMAPLAIGETGELVITTLTKQALPMIRYRTHDITRLSDEPCPWGAPICASCASPGATTTCSSSAGSTSIRPRSKQCWSASPASRPITRSCSAARARSTLWRSRSSAPRTRLMMPRSAPRRPARCSAASNPWSG
jgi:phenylacetate-CoA ligase